MKKSIGYRITKRGDFSHVLNAGSFGGCVDLETVNRFVSAHLGVKVLDSGAPVFVDKNGQQVVLTFIIDPLFSDMGILAKRVHDAQVSFSAEEKERELADLMAGMSTEEIIARLKSN